MAQQIELALPTMKFKIQLVKQFGKQECVLERLEPPHLSSNISLVFVYKIQLSFVIRAEDMAPVNISNEIMCNKNNLQ